MYITKIILSDESYWFQKIYYKECGIFFILMDLLYEKWNDRWKKINKENTRMVFYLMENKYITTKSKKKNPRKENQIESMEIIIIKPHVKRNLI